MAEALYTDRRHLTTRAYGDSANLQARASIYAYQQPQVDFVGWALDQITWDGVRRVLDIGCGPGLYLRRLAARGVPALLAMDLSRGMLADLRAGWDGGRPSPGLAVADAQALPLADGCCDAALAMHMLYHVPDIERAARELRRVVRPGGALLAATGGEGHLREMHALYGDALSELAGGAGDVPRTNPLAERFSLDNGAPPLHAAFAHVEPREIVAELLIPEPGPVLRYFNSGRATREASLPPGVAWEALMAEVERRVAAEIAARGVFRVSTRAGLFVCR